MMILVYLYSTLSYSIIKDEQASLTNPFLMSSLYPVSHWLSRAFFVPENFLDQGIKCQDVSPLLLIPSLYLTEFRMSRTFFLAQLGWPHLSFINANEQAILPHS